MNTVKIEDLSITEELGAKEMSAVSGGSLAMYYMPWGGYSNSSEKNFSFEALQQINQGQSVQTAVGNNVAVLGGFASPTVPVSATQHADITNNVMF